MPLHERTGTVDRYEAEGRDPFAKQFIRWDDPTKCCGEPDCRAKPTAEAMLSGTQRVPAYPVMRGCLTFPPAPVGARVRTWWEKGLTYGGTVGEVIEHDQLELRNR